MRFLWPVLRFGRLMSCKRVSDVHSRFTFSFWKKKKDNCRYDNTSTIIIDYYERYHNWVKVITGFIQYWKVIEFAWSPLNNFTYVMPCFWTSNIMWETCLVQFLWSSAAVSWGVTCALHNRKYGNLSNFHSYLEFFDCPWKEFKSWFAVQTLLYILSMCA